MFIEVIILKRNCRKMVILHLIGRLNRNGKTILLKNIIENMPENTENVVLTIRSGGPLVQEFALQSPLFHFVMFPV